MSDWKFRGEKGKPAKLWRKGAQILNGSSHKKVNVERLTFDAAAHLARGAVRLEPEKIRRTYKGLRDFSWASNIHHCELEAFYLYDPASPILPTKEQLFQIAL